MRPLYRERFSEAGGAFDPIREWSFINEKKVIHEFIYRVPDVSCSVISMFIGPVTCLPT